MKAVKAVLHIDEADKWPVLLRNAGHLVEAVDVPLSEIHVVAHADAVDAYLPDGAFSDDMIRLFSKGIVFKACRNSLNSRGISPESLQSFAVIVPSGILELLALQDQGFSYVKP
jgi:intracellular sulfur oxidation DsrE/DsrF family protein